MDSLEWCDLGGWPSASGRQSGSWVAGELAATRRHLPHVALGVMGRFQVLEAAAALEVAAVVDAGCGSLGLGERSARPAAWGEWVTARAPLGAAVPCHHHRLAACRTHAPPMLPFPCPTHTAAQHGPSPRVPG